jgi:Smg protein
MKESVLDVLMYLFEHYVDEDMEDLEPDREQLEIRLLDAGFPTAEIDRAFDWLDGLVEQGSALANSGTNASLRLYTQAEMTRLDSELRGFLLFLEQGGILTSTTRELVIDRVMALNEEEIDLEQLKWVVLMVLFNQPDRELAYSDLEDLVFEETPPYLH